MIHDTNLLGIYSILLIYTGINKKLQDVKISLNNQIQQII